MTLEILLTGEAAEELAAPARELLFALAKRAPEERIAEDSAETVRSSGEMVQLITLIIAVPCAVESTLNLLEKAKLTPKISALLKKARASSGSAVLKMGQHPYLDLKNTDEDAVRDLVFKDGD